MKTKSQVLAMMWALLAEIENKSSVGVMLRTKLNAYLDIMEYEEITKDMYDTIYRLGLAYMLD